MATIDDSPTDVRARRPVRDLRRFWRITAAIVIPLPVLALTVENLIAPFPLGSEFREVIAGSAAHPGAARAGLWLSLVFTLLMVPATMAVAWTARRGAPRLAFFGGLLTLVAFTAGVGLPNSDLAALVAAEKGLDPALVTVLDDTVWAHPAVGLQALLFLLGQAIGLILLGITLWRGGVTPSWVGLALALSGPAHLLAPGGNVGNAVSWALTAIGYIGASVALLRTGDDDFDLPPTGREQPMVAEFDVRPGRDFRTAWRVLLAVTTPIVALYVAVGRYLLPYDMSDGPREIFDKLVAAPGFQAANIWLGTICIFVAFSGVLAVAWVARRRAPLLTTVAVMLALPGYIALFASGPHMDVITHAVGTQTVGVDRETAFQLSQGMEDSPWTGALIGIFVFGHLAGTVLLGLAMWRARVVPAWLALGLAVSQPLHLASVISGVRELDLVGWGLTAIGFAAAGWSLLRMTNDEFDLPPESHSIPIRG